MQFLELTLLFKNGRTTVRSLPCSLTLIFLKKNTQSFIHRTTGHKDPEGMATRFLTSARPCPSCYLGKTTTIIPFRREPR